MTTKNMQVKKFLPYLIPAFVLIVAIIFPYVVDRPKFWVPNVGVRSIWLGIIAMSLIFLNRYMGLLSLAQTAVSAFAAYALGFTLVTLEFDWWLAALIAVIAGTLFSMLAALVSIRTNAIYFLMITLAISQALHSWASQEALVGGRRGLAPIRRPDMGILDMSDMYTFYYVAVVAAFGCYFLCKWLVSTPFGMSIQGIKDSPERMKALGYPIMAYRIGAITFAGFIASIGGLFMAYDRMQVDPDVVSLNATLNVLVVAVIGGISTLGGAFIGGVIFALLDNFAPSFTDRYMTLTGIIFIAVLLFSPEGISGLLQRAKKTFIRIGNKKVPEAGDETTPGQSALSGSPVQSRKEEND